LEIEWSHYVLNGVEGIDLEEMEGFIKYRANKMLRMIGLSEIYPEHVNNPMKWIRAYVDNFDGTKTDFFEQRNRQYTKVTDLNGFDDL
jgi:ribonucleoside-diphosphate reductase beta chain